MATQSSVVSKADVEHGLTYFNIMKKIHIVSKEGYSTNWRTIKTLFSYMVMGGLMVGSTLVESDVELGTKLLISNVSFYILMILIYTNVYSFRLINTDTLDYFKSKPISNKALGLGNLMFTIYMLGLPFLCASLLPCIYIFMNYGIVVSCIYLVNLCSVFICSICTVGAVYALLLKKNKSFYLMKLINYSQSFMLIVVVVFQILLTSYINHISLSRFGFMVQANMVLAAIGEANALYIIPLLMTLVLLGIYIRVITPSINRNLYKLKVSSNQYHRQTQSKFIRNNSPIKQSIELLVKTLIVRDEVTKRHFYQYFNSILLLFVICIQMIVFNIYPQNVDYKIYVLLIAFLNVLAAARIFFSTRFSSNASANNLFKSIPCTIDSVYKQAGLSYWFIRINGIVLPMVAVYLLMFFKIEMAISIFIGIVGYTLLTWSIYFKKIRHDMPFSYLGEIESPPVERAVTASLIIAMIIVAYYIRFNENTLRLLTSSIFLLLASVLYFKKTVIEYLKIKPYPIVIQKKKNDCGIACVEMILRSQRIPFSKDELDKHSLKKLKANGLSLLNLIEILNEFNLKSEGYGFDNNSIESIKVPCIVHLCKNKTNHYVVMYEYSKDWVLIGDPNSGLRKISINKFTSLWSGKAILI